MLRSRWLTLVLVCGLPCLAFGCFRPFEVGPVTLTVRVGEGSMLEEAFSGKQFGVDFTTYDDLCEFPPEDGLADDFQAFLQDDNGRLIRLSRLELTQLDLNATEGDFSFLSAIKVSFVPAPSDGDSPTPVELGSASDANGFGASIILTPPDDVNFLTLIRQDEANASEECPQAKVEVRLRQIPLSDVRYEVYATIDAYATVFPG